MPTVATVSRVPAALLAGAGTVSWGNREVPDLEPGPYDGGEDLPPSYASSGGVAWMEPGRRIIYRAVDGGPTDVGVSLNNGWWMAAVGQRMFAVYQNEDGYVALRSVRIGTPPAFGSPAPSALLNLLAGGSGSTWTGVHPFEDGSGNADGYVSSIGSAAAPCLAARDVGGTTAVVVAYVNADQGLSVAHSADGYAQVEIALPGSMTVSSPSLVMDEDGYAYLVFTGTLGRTNTGVFLTVRDPATGAWSDPTQVNSEDDDPDSGRAFDHAGFGSVAVSGAGDRNGGGAVVMVTYTAYLDGNDANGRIRGRALDRTSLSSTSPDAWDLTAASEWDVAGADLRRDSCVVATAGGRFIVGFVQVPADPRDDPVVYVRWNDNPADAASAWTEQSLEGATRQGGKMDFPSLAVSLEGVCLVVWEDFGPNAGDPQIPYGAVASVLDLTSWRSLGNVTPGAEGTDQGQFPCAVVAGGPRVGWLWADEAATPADLVWRAGRWT